MSSSRFFLKPINSSIFRAFHYDTNPSLRAVRKYIKPEYATETRKLMNATVKPFLKQSIDLNILQNVGKSLKTSEHGKRPRKNGSKGAKGKRSKSIRKRSKSKGQKIGGRRKGK